MGLNYLKYLAFQALAHKGIAHNAIELIVNLKHY
jgi:hypothetical protein